MGTAEESTRTLVLRPRSATLTLSQAGSSAGPRVDGVQRWAWSTLTFGQPGPGAESRELELRADVDRKEHIRTVDGRSLQEAVWVVRLFEDDALSELNEEGFDVIGRLSYCAAIPADDFFSKTPEGCEVSASLSPAVFSTLLRCVLARSLPDRLLLRVRGLSSGWEPDGSGTEWDIDEKPDIWVTGVTFSLPIIDPHGPDE